MNKERRHQMICKVIDDRFRTYTYEELYQYVFDKEYTQLSRIEDDQLTDLYEEAIRHESRKGN